LLEAGAVHGITPKTEFTLFEDRNFLLRSEPLGEYIVGDIGHFTTELLPLPETSVSLDGLMTIVALQSKAGESQDLILYIPMPVDERLLDVFEALHRLMEVKGETHQSIRVIDEEHKDSAKLEITLDGDDIVINHLDPRVVAYGLTRVPYTLKPNPDVVFHHLRAIGRYYWHLDRASVSNNIQDKIKVQFHELEISDEMTNHGERRRLPHGPDLVKDGTVDLVINEDSIYGLNIVNKSSEILYAYIFLFDHSDFSIREYF